MNNYEIQTKIEKLQRASIGNSDPAERATISRDLSALNAQLHTQSPTPESRKAYSVPG